MIDAGSSGTRAYIYRWDPRTIEHDAILPVSKPVSELSWYYHTNIPLARFANESQLITPYLENIMSNIKQIFTTIVGLHTAHDWSTIPVYLGATAGLRLQPIEQREIILNAVHEYFLQSGFAFEPSYAKILSGEEEGFFGYIAVAYLKEQLFQSFNERYGGSLSASSTNLGALDMGGASTQITFAPHQDILEGYFEYITPNNIRHQLFTASFLHYGNLDFQNRILLAVTANATDDVVDSPCHSEGWVFMYHNIDTDRNVTITGHYDHIKCTEFLDKSLMFFSTPCLVEPCGINGRYMPTIPPNTVFAAFSGFTKVLSMYMPIGLITVQNIIDTRDKLCSLTFQQLVEHYSNIPMIDLNRACSTFEYFSLLLIQGYHFDPLTPLLVGDLLDNTHVDWTLGRMVYEANLLQPTVLNDNNSQEWFLLLGISFLGGLVICTCIILCMCFVCRKNHSSPSHDGQLILSDAIISQSDDYLPPLNDSSGDYSIAT